MNIESRKIPNQEHFHAALLNECKKSKVWKDEKVVATYDENGLFCFGIEEFMKSEYPNSILCK